MTEEIRFSVKEKLLSQALNCQPKLIRSLWHETGLSSFDNFHDIKQFKEVSKTYNKMHELLARLRILHKNLPQDEKIRLLLQAKLIGQQAEGDVLEALLNSLNELLRGLLGSREYHANSSQIDGGKDPMANQLAEFVARVFEESGQTITYGHREDLPTTNFCRAVQKTIRICNSIRSDGIDDDSLSNWRQPAHQAFLRRKS